MQIRLSSIHIGKRFRQDKDVSDLLDDFVKGPQKQITPITVRPPTEEEIEMGVDKPWVLVAGGRRTATAMLCGWEFIEAFDRGMLDELTAREMELHENLKRKNMHFTEEVALKAELVRLRQLKNPELTQAEIARSIGETPANLSRDLQTHNAIVENPSLAKASSKRAAHGAAQMLKHAEAQIQRTMSVAQQPAYRANFEDKLLVGAAEDLLPAIPSRSIDLHLLDGPYGYNYWKSGQKMEDDESHLAKYDDDPRRTGEMYRTIFPDLVRTCRETGWLIFFCGEETYEFLGELARDCCSTHASYRSAGAPAQCEIAAHQQTVGACRFLLPEVPGWIWYRPNSRNNPRYGDLHAKNVYENILIINMGKGRILRRPCPNLLVHDAVYENRVHPNEKPITLYKDLIERFTFPGDRVHDCFHGSGNSLAAAAALGRDFLGSDKNPTMHQFALARVQQYYAPMSQAAIKESFERYKRGLERNPEGIEDFTQEEVIAPPPPGAMNKFLDEKLALEEAQKQSVEDFKANRESAARGAAEARRLEEQKELEEAGLA